MDDAVEFAAVEVVSATIEGLLCRVGARRVVIPSRLLVRSALRKPGDRGKLVLPRWVATRLGIEVARPG